MATITEPHPKQLFKARIALGLGILCLGFAAIFVKLAGVSGSVSAFYRTLVASSVILPCWLIKPQKLPAFKDIVIIVIGGIAFSLTLALWNTSVMYTSAATATLLVNGAPLWVGLASFVLFREHLSKLYWTGLLIATFGMLWLVGSEAYEQLRLSYGNSLALGSSLSYAAYLLITQKTRSRVDLLTFMVISLITSMIVLLIVNIAIGTTLTGYKSSVWFALICLGLVTQLGGWLGINYALGHMKASQASVWLLAESVVTAMVAIPLLHEYLKINQIAGGLMILGGIYLVTQNRNK